MVRFALALAMIACCTASAVADVAPPPPEKGFKRVPYQYIVKLETEPSGYKFYAFRDRGPARTIGDELKLGTENGVAVPSNPRPHDNIGVVAVPEKVMNELKTKENLAKLLFGGNNDKLPAGVVVYETRGIERDLKESDPRTKVEIVITISVDENDGVKFSVKETPEPSTQPPLAIVIAGIAAALAIATLGIWYFRRGTRAKGR